MILLSVGLWLFAWPDSVGLKPDYSRRVMFENGKLARAYLSTDQKWRFPVELIKLPKWLQPALYCLEDKRFEYHIGVDPVALTRAMYQNVEAQKIVSGASTLTMQVARLTEPRQRTIFAKIIESFRATQIEARYSKAEILELYLNKAPFGGNIEGLETAAFRYFQKSAQWLSYDEFAFLMTLPQSPPRWDRLSNLQISKIRNQKLQKLSECGLINEEELKYAVSAKVPDVRSGFEIHAEHWSDDLLSENPQMKTIHSTLNYDIQKSGEALIRKKRADWQNKGVQNIGVIVIENATGKVLSAVGNFDYFESENEQKFSGYKVFRSTGSVLKPFFYASLLSSGEILPETLLEDVPFDFHGYNPKNYDGLFSGLVESQWALAHSLNLPWIKKLSEVGVDSLLSFLKSGGITLNLRSEDIGLSMIIGGIQASLLDLTRMYTAFPNEGKLFPLQKISGELNTAAENNGFQWFHPGAAELTSRALSVRGRPDYSIDPFYFRDDLGIRWKTGTSQGRKDAWAIGYSRNMTIGVWLGNMNNEPSPALVGPEIAAPLLFELFAIVKSKNEDYWKSLVSNNYSPLLQKIEVCSFSGQMPGPNCKHLKTVDAPKGIVPRHRCNLHQEALVDKKSGLRIHQDCKIPGSEPVLRSFLTLPGDIQMWLNDSLHGAQMQPPFHPKCKWLTKEKGSLEIVEPSDDNYIITGGVSKNEIILPLKIRSPDKAESPNCYLNGEKIKMDKSDFQQILRLKPGDYNLMCLDKVGRSDQIKFSVEL
ncbi:MAG: penicillin-binding protein 1C [Bdellovibrionota bacterium]